ncbi:hypothetical protein AB4Z09_26780 [Rhodococcus sp. TAF43]|uniref:hypothetical protein n=1 Tax=unclassified Rhodococcus (in: high G+C Gram-positive bacteria) TaxID=192944 RepID=UPI000E0C4E32|nr:MULTISPECIES: hypothetical protein [unclassified Rhodococcus (in: high G+C Gram-positive bacteria)]QKT13695.1 hypothetical protein HUN07_25725 [Rhodococcus sp. W8901]RDI14291.1 hypothetical protein DEU38_13332 [Rhodococcus sp. AG1013]
MNRRFAASLMFVTAGILMVPAAGAASAATQGVGSVYCASGEVKSEDGLSCATTDINGEMGTGSSVFGIDLTDLVSLIGSIASS